VKYNVYDLGSHKFVFLALGSEFAFLKFVYFIHNPYFSNLHLFAM
jgi:hypothetical protein